MESPKVQNVEQWVDEQMEALSPAANWRPDSDRARALLNDLDHRSRTRQTRIWLLAGCAAAVVMLSVLPSMVRSDSLPDFELTNVAGGTTKATDLQGKVTVVDFWATWCVPCIREIPRFNELHEAYLGKNVEIIGIVVESDVPQIPAKVHEFDVKYRVLLGNEHVVQGFGGIHGFPTTFVVGQDWKIYKSYRGALPDKHDRIKKDIEDLLNYRASSR